MEPFERFVAAVRRPPTAVPLDEAALCLAAHGSPGLDVDEQLARLDALAAACPARSFAGVMAHLFRAEGFAGDTEHYDDPRNSFLDQVLDRRRGLPITLAVLAIETGRRVGVAVVGIGMPGHFLVRDGDDDESFADPFGGGTLLDAAGCRRLFATVAGRQPWQDQFLAPVDSLTIVRRMLNNLQASYQRRDDLAGLAWVLRLRGALPGATAEQRDEALRLLAPLN